MQRINLGTPYEDFIKSMIESGYYGTATEVIRDALRDKMEKMVSLRQLELQRMLQKGIDDIEAGRTVPYSADLFKKLHEEAIANKNAGKPIRPEVKP